MLGKQTIYILLDMKIPSNDLLSANVQKLSYK